MNETSKRNIPARHKAASKSTAIVHWRDESPCESMSSGGQLSVEAHEPFVLHFGRDGWQDITDLDSQPLGSGWYAARLDTKRLGVKQSIEFTRRFLGPRSWEQHDWQVRLGSANHANIKG